MQGIDSDIANDEVPGEWGEVMEEGQVHPVKHFEVFHPVKICKD